MQMSKGIGNGHMQSLLCNVCRIYCFASTSGQEVLLQLARAAAALGLVRCRLASCLAKRRRACWVTAGDREVLANGEADAAAGVCSGGGDGSRGTTAGADALEAAAGADAGAGAASGTAAVCGRHQWQKPVCAWRAWHTVVPVWPTEGRR